MKRSSILQAVGLDSRRRWTMTMRPLLQQPASDSCKGKPLNSAPSFRFLLRQSGEIGETHQTQNLTGLNSHVGSIPSFATKFLIAGYGSGYRAGSYPVFRRVRFSFPQPFRLPYREDRHRYG